MVKKKGLLSDLYSIQASFVFNTNKKKEKKKGPLIFVISGLFFLFFFFFVFLYASFNVYPRLTKVIMSTINSCLTYVDLCNSFILEF